MKQISHPRIFNHLVPLISVLLTLISLTSCNNLDSSSGNFNDNTLEWCYAYRDGDAVQMIRLSETENTIHGNMQKFFPGTEINEGILSGKSAGDTLFLQYFYQDQGSDTLEQLIFLRKGDFLIPIEKDVNISYSANSLPTDVQNKLEFSFKLSRAECNDNEQLASKFQIAWSVLQSDFIDLKRYALALHSTKKLGKTAYLLFSSGGTQAEIILPDNQGSLFLSQQEKPDQWRNGAFRLVKGSNFEFFQGEDLSFVSE